MAYYQQICLEATSAAASKQYVVGLEEKLNEAKAMILDLETALAVAKETAEKAKKEALSAVNSRNKVTAEYNKQKLELAAKCAEVETTSTIVAALSDVAKELKAVEWAAKERATQAEETLARFQSQAYVDTIVSEFQASDAYKDAIAEASYGYMKQGKNHMVRQLHYYFKDKAPVINAYEMLLTNKEARDVADYVPYSEAEVKELQEYDAEEHLEAWTPPAPSVPTFFDLLVGEPSNGAELLEMATGEGQQEVATDVAEIVKPVLPEGALMPEEVLPTDSALPTPPDAGEVAAADISPPTGTL